MDLRDDERILFEGRPAWRALLSFYLAGLIAGAVVVVLLGVVAGSMGTALAIGAAIVVATLVIGYLRRLFTKYLITTQRLRISVGLVRRKVQEARLDRVQNVNYAQGVIDRMLDVGNVDFDTAGTDDSEFRFVGISDPGRIAAVVDDAQRKLAT